MLLFRPPSGLASYFIARVPVRARKRACSALNPSVRVVNIIMQINAKAVYCKPVRQRCGYKTPTNPHKICSGCSSDYREHQKHRGHLTSFFSPHVGLVLQFSWTHEVDGSIRPCTSYHRRLPLPLCVIRILFCAV